MLPEVYHLQKVSFGYHLTDLSYFVIAHHPDHARQVLADYLTDLNKPHDTDLGYFALNCSAVQFIATLVNNENICACVLEL